MKRQIVGLVVLFSVFACLLTTIIVNSKYIFRTEPYYSETQVEEMCDEAYKQSIKDNSDQALYNKMSELTVQNLELTNTNNSLISQNESLKNQVVTNEKTINDLNLQIENLTNVKLENETEISNLNSIVLALEQQVVELEKQNKLLEYEISQNETLIEENNKTISQLENSIRVYEDYINGVESDKEVFAIFVVEKEIINVQKLNINGLAYLENQPVFDENTTFNGWVVNNEIVDLSSYTLSCNTTFVADLTYSYTINFIVDDEIYNSQTIIKDNFVSAPEIPLKEGYKFTGWSLNKADIISNIDTIKVTKNINYYAMFEKAYTVNFVVDNETYNSQLIIENDFIELPSNPSKDGFMFIGWSLTNDYSVVDVTSSAVVENVIYYACFVPEYEGRTASVVYNDETIGSVEVIGYDLYVILNYGYKFNNYTIKIQLPNSSTTYYWKISNTTISGNIVDCAVSGSTSYAYVDCYFNSDGCIVYKIHMKHEHVIINSQTITGASIRPQYIYYYIASDSANYDDFIDVVPSTSSFKLLSTDTFLPTSADEVCVLNLKDVVVPNGYKVELYYSIDKPFGVSYSDLTYIGVVGEISSYDFIVTFSHNSYVVARYVKL